MSRPIGSYSKQTTALRQQMEELLGEPLPIYLLKMGIQLRADGMIPEAITAIKGSIDYAYPKLRAVELSGQVDMTPVLEIVSSAEALLHAPGAAS